MELKDLYGFVLLLVVIGLLLGVSALILDKFYASSGLTANAQYAIGNTTEALRPIPNTWLPVITVIAAASIVLTLVIRSFRQ
jgi:hypothetical protein